MVRRIVIIAKGSSLWTQLRHHLRQQGFAVSMTEHGEQAVPSLAGAGPCLVLLGLEGLKREGITVLRTIRTHYPQVDVITINAGNQLDLSIEAMRLGAFDDFLIPFDLDSLMACITKAFGKTHIRSRKETP